MNEIEFRTKLLEEAYSEPELIERAAGLTNEDHTHDFAAALLIKAGEITVTTSEGETTCHAGDTFFLEAGVVHREQYGPNGATILAGKRMARHG